MMLQKIRLFLLLSAWAFILSIGEVNPAAGQQKKVVIPPLLSDKTALELLEKGLPLMYGHDFAQARRYFAEVQARHPEHPVTPLLNALLLFWQHMPFDNFEGKNFKQHSYFLEKTIAASQKMLDVNPNDVEGVFFMLTARGLLMQHYNERGESMQAVGEAKQLYGLIKTAFDLRSQNVELNFMTGLYSYYRAYYPERYPVYRPFVIFFKEGNKKEGLENLETCTQKAIFTANEAAGYLTHIYLRYENNHEKALAHSRQLAQRFPNNPHYVAAFIETALLTKRYDEAAKMLPALQKSERPLFMAAAQVFSGMLAEFQRKDLTAAVKSYQAAENLLLAEKIGYANPYKLYTYAGLYRYYKQQRNQPVAQRYYKQAKALDDYEYLKSDF
jgi:tetratricopeptide (TPR) repeat protein